MYFFDTYAIIEMIKSKPAYEKFSEFPVITTAMNVAEVLYVLCDQIGEENANKIVKQIPFSLLNIEQTNAILASQFRWNNRKKKFSYIDCLGYTIAQEQGLLFVTGDDAFANEPGVVFLK